MISRIWPILEPLMHAQIQPVEGRLDDFAQDLDIEAGLDYRLRLVNGQFQFLASRVQWRHRPWGDAPWALGRCPQTYTTRTRTAGGSQWTEMPKKRESIRSETELPYWTLQAYMERPGGPVEMIGIVQTRTLYRRIEELIEADSLPTKTAADGSEFAYIKWDELPGYRWSRMSPKHAVTQPTLFGGQWRANRR